jgi:hypothetical protein
MSIRRALSALTIDRLMALVLLLCLFVMAVRPITDPDFWWHLRTGEYIWDTRSIPRQDIYSHTLPGQPWITHEWLTEVALYAVYALSGQAGLILAFALVIAASFALLYLRCPGRPYLAAFVVVLAALSSAVTWGVRPQMMTLLLSSGFLYILHLYRRGHRRVVWLMPPLMVLWANLHGSFLMGLVLPATHVVGAALDRALGRQQEAGLTWKEIRKLAIITALTAVAPIFNPNGVHLLIYPFGTLGSPAMQSYIMEWFSPDFHLVQFQPFALFILVLLASLGLSRRIPSATDFLFMLGFGYASLRSARHIPLVILTTTPMLTAQLLSIWRAWGVSRRFEPGRRSAVRQHFVVNWLLLGVLILGVTLQVASTLSGNEAIQRDTFPADAVDFLIADQAPGNMYNLYRWGGYLIWRLYPERSVFIDGRADVYGDEFIEEYLQVYQLREGWDESLARYDVGLVLIDRTSALSTVLKETPAWDCSYTDELAAVFVRQDAVGP